MKFGLINQSTVCTTAECKAISAALNIQARDLAIAWDRKRPTCAWYDSLASVPTDRVIIAILDDPDTAGALGYHDVGPDGRPYAKVFAKLFLDDGGTVLSGAFSVSACASHEFVESFGDPTCLLWDTYGAKGEQICHELGDPVQNDSYDVKPLLRPTVSLSNYVLPRYFDPWNAAGPWDYMGTLKGPAPHLSPGGYAIVESSSGEKQIFGEMPAWKQGLQGRSAGRLS